MSGDSVRGVPGNSWSAWEKVQKSKKSCVSSCAFFDSFAKTDGVRMSRIATRLQLINMGSGPAHLTFVLMTPCDYQN
jgi:hypothetical protein